MLASEIAVWASSWPTSPSDLALAQVAEQLARLRRDRDDADARGELRRRDQLRLARHGAEVGRARAHALELPRELDDVEDLEVAVLHDVGGDGLHEPRKVRDLARGEELREHGPQELLLASDAREVGNRVAGLVPRPDEGERRPPVELLAARLDVEPGQHILHRIRHAHAHAAERIDHALEPGEVDVEEVVDVQAGEVLDGPGDEIGAAAAHAALERAVDLVHAVAGDGNPEVAREAQDDRLLAVRIDVDEHDRVGPLLAPEIGVGAGDDLILVAEAGPGVAAEEQVVAGAADARAADDLLAGLRVPL